MPLISIITASHKNISGLKNLYERINKIQSNDFNWVIKDSGACKETSLWLAGLVDTKIQYDNSIDSGIYNALNTAIKISAAKYYITVGSDDDLNAESFDLLLNNLKENSFLSADVIALPVIINDTIKHRNKLIPSFISATGLISSHSVGTVIKKELHFEFGYYDESYKILSDSLFIVKIYRNNKKFIYPKLKPLGSFSLSGISNNNHSLKIIEAYNYNIELGGSRILQSILLMLRIIKYKVEKIALAS
jgi:hypothetical protein